MSSKGRNFRLSLLCAAVAIAVLAVAAGCQTYDFEPVQPLAISQRTQTKTITASNLKPNVYLLVDSSGSMSGPTNPSDPNCALPDGGVCGGTQNTPCPSSCATRWGDMTAAMHQFLINNGTVARMGLSFFPSDNICGPANAVAVPLDQSNDDPSSLQNTANAIDQALQLQKPGGGTPTAPSVAFADQQYTPTIKQNRQSFVLLLTDGLPNCDKDLDGNTCTCTAAPTASTPNPCSGFPIACLDDNATVDEITTLAAESPSIKTIVVGFGADTASGLGPQVLTEMANAGGYPKSCPNGTDAECGSNDTCNTATHVCNKPYYQASNAAELAATLAAIGGQIETDACTFKLDQAPSDPSLLSVLVNGTETPGCPDKTGCDTWYYDAPGQAVVFTGQLCTDIQGSNNSNPYKIEVQIVQSL